MKMMVALIETSVLILPIMAFAGARNVLVLSKGSMVPNATYAQNLAAAVLHVL
jgi:hypothetical protein